MKDMKFHHIGYVVPSIKNFKEYQLFLASKKPILVFDDNVHNAKVEFHLLNANFFFEIIEPLKKESHFSNFFKKNIDGGLHHLCYESADLEKDTKKMKLNKYRQITKPSKGFESRENIFFIPRKLSSPLIELVSKPKAKDRILPKIRN